MMRSRCAVCGTEVETRSARREGKLWFCSYSCFLQYESSGGRPGQSNRNVPRRPMGFIRRTLRWTLIVVVLVVALALALALIDGRTGGKSAAKQVAGQSQSDAIPLHVVGGVWDGWRL
jgi:hypothetical protein